MAITFATPASPQSPPDGWTVTSGTWGTNMYAAPNSGGVGYGGVVMNSGTMVSDFVSLDTLTADVGYVATAKLNYTVTTGAPTVNFVTYQADKATKVSTLTLLNASTGSSYGAGKGTFSATFTSASTAAFGRWEITAVAQCYLYTVNLERIRTSLNLTQASATTFAASAWTAVGWSLAQGYEANLVTGTNIALRKAGLYLFAANITLITNGAAYAAGTTIQTRIASVSASGTVTAVSPVYNKYIASASDTQPTISWTQAIAVSSMVNAVNFSAYVPYYQVQVNPSIASKTVPTGCSCSVVLLN